MLNRNAIIYRITKDLKIISFVIFTSIAAKFIVDALNESVNPCEDFFEFACGGYNDLHNPTDVQPHVSNRTLIMSYLNNYNPLSKVS